MGIFTASDTIAPNCKIQVTNFGEAISSQTPDGVSEKSELNTPTLVRPLETILGSHHKCCGYLDDRYDDL